MSSLTTIMVVKKFDTEVGQEGEGHTDHSNEDYFGETANGSKTSSPLTPHTEGDVLPTQQGLGEVALQEVKAQAVAASKNLPKMVIRSAVPSRETQQQLADVPRMFSSR